MTKPEPLRPEQEKFYLEGCASVLLEVRKLYEEFAYYADQEAITYLKKKLSTLGKLASEACRQKRGYEGTKEDRYH